MRRIRVIPILLLEDKNLIKTQEFKNPVYLGDPINAVKIFNDKGADELVLLDIKASKQGGKPNFDYIQEIISESFMPLCYGGGIQTFQDAEKLLKMGIEKVSLNYGFHENPNLIRQIADTFGSQACVVSIDYNKTFLGAYHTYTLNGKVKTKYNLLDAAKYAEDCGAGEILLTSIARESQMKGYDIDILKKVASVVTIPVIANGGAGSISDFKDAIVHGNASAVAAGSFFVFHGKLRGVLIQYPSQNDLKTNLFSKI